jgi:glycosyltransferase involved in cell wall biosynthesis
MRILVVTDHLRRDGRNGAEVFSSELCGQLERRHRLTVVTRAEPPPSLLRQARVLAVGDGVPGKPELLAEFLRSQLRFDDFDLLYNLGGLLFGSQVVHLLRLLGCALPLVNHFQVLLGEYAREEGLSVAEERAHAALQKAVSGEAVLNVHPSQAECMRAAQQGFGGAASGVAVIPNGVGGAAFDAVEPDDSWLPEPERRSANRRLILATAGRFSDRVKGADLIYRAFVRLCQDRRDLFLLSIGNAPRFAEMLSALRADSYRRLDWLPRDRFLAVLAAADAVVLPSRYEPFGMIAVEAMRLGLPVVAHAVGGLREIVSHGETGLLAPLEDGSFGLYCALAELTEDRDTMRAMGRAGRRRAMALYDLERVAEEVEQALRLALLEADVRPVRTLLADYAAPGRQ